MTGDVFLQVDTHYLSQVLSQWPAICEDFYIHCMYVPPQTYTALARKRTTSEIIKSVVPDFG